MDEWREISLGEICTDISYGYTESATEKNIGPRFLRITDIAGPRLNWSKVPFCPITDANFKKYCLSPGDIVIARTGATTGANYTLKPSDPTDVVYASYLIRYKINKAVGDPYFIGHILQSNKWKEFVKGIAGGSAQPGANAKQLGSFQFNLPPLPEQKAISSVLSSLDDKIDLLHRQNETLEQLAETIFRQWFIEEAQDDWEIGKLEDFIEIRYGKDHKHLNEGNIPVYGSGGIMRYADTALWAKPSVLIPRKGTLENVILVTEPFWSVDTMFYTSIKKENSLYFVYQFVKTLDLAGMNVGSAVPSMTSKALNSVEVRIPPFNVIHDYEVKAKALFAKIFANKKQISTLEKQRDTLLPKLMSGEVRVKH